jgi:putative heme iron utilization protein
VGIQCGDLVNLKNRLVDRYRRLKLEVLIITLRIRAYDEFRASYGEFMMMEPKLWIYILTLV